MDAIVSPDGELYPYSTKEESYSNYYPEQFSSLGSVMHITEIMKTEAAVLTNLNNRLLKAGRTINKLNCASYLRGVYRCKPKMETLLSLQKQTIERLKEFQDPDLTKPKIYTLISPESEKEHSASVQRAAIQQAEREKIIIETVIRHLNQIEQQATALGAYKYHSYY